MAIGQELLNVPMGEMIRDMALSIAEAQIALDASSMRVAEMMSGKVWQLNPNGTPMAESTSTDNPNPRDTSITFPTFVDGKRVATRMTMLELGFTPTFYQFVDTIIEVKVSISFASESSYQSQSSSFHMSMAGGFFLGFGGGTVRTTSVSASYASKYNYSAEGASLLRTKLVVVPPPTILEERIRRLIDNPPGGPTPAPAP